MTLATVPIPEGAPTPGELASRLGDYRDFRCIGAGGMGVVYEARHIPLDRMVAVKVLPPSFVRSNVLERFFREARAMARIDHPNIVPVFEVAPDNAFPYFTMGLVTGGSLRELMDEGPLAPRTAATIARDVAAALAHAHTANILHRDVKPQNVLLEPSGAARLTDFGLVRQEGAATLTASDAMVGTPDYMSPEQVNIDSSIDGRSDLFALGLTLFEATTGKHPFKASSPGGTLRAIADHEPPSIERLRPGLSRDLQAIILRLLEKDPGRRYPTAEHCRDDLDRFLQGEAVEASLPSPLSRRWRRLRANPLASRLALAVVVLGTLVGYAGFSKLWVGRQARLQEALLAATTLLDAGEPLKAVALLDPFGKRQLDSPESVALHVRLADDLLDRGRMLRAKRVVELLEEGGPSASTLLLRAKMERVAATAQSQINARAAEASWTRAQDYLSAAAKEGSRPAAVWRERGYLALSREDWSAAEDAFNQGLTLDPADIAALEGRSAARTRLEDATGAAEDSRMATLLRAANEKFLETADQARELARPISGPIENAGRATLDLVRKLLSD